jgi:hypothetical protein
MTNELQQHAKAALNVLHRVQLSLERIRTGDGSAALLPTIADQLRDAIKIVEIAADSADTVDLLDGLRKAKEEADQASADLSSTVRLHRFNRLADQLGDAFGPVPLSRPDLLAFLADQVERIKAVGVPDSTTATALIDAAYVELQQQHG